MTSSITYSEVKTQLFENPWNENGTQNTPKKKNGTKFVIWNTNNKNQDPQSLDKGLKLILLLILVVPLLLWLSTGFYTIEPDQEGVIIRFGQYIGKSQPGLRYKFPDPIDQVIKVGVTTINRELIGARMAINSDSANKDNKIDIPEESQMLTGDENILEAQFFVQWKIKDSYNYVFKIRDNFASENNTLRLSAESAMREVMGLVKLNDAISEQRQDIEKQAKIILQKMLDEYLTGIEVVNLGILYSYVPSDVKDAYRDIQAAKADKERAINEAYAYRNDILPKARGEAFAMLENAKAKKESIIADAMGQAGKFISIHTEYKLAPEITKKRLYIETMESVLSNKDKTLFTKGIGASTLPIIQMQNSFKDKNLQTNDK